MNDLKSAAKLALDWFKCNKDGSMSRNNAEALADEVIEALEEALAKPERVAETGGKVHEVVYAYRRKGFNSFCTCDEERYLEVAEKPKVFEVTKFYLHPPELAATERKCDNCGEFGECCQKQEQGEPLSKAFLLVCDVLKHYNAVHPDAMLDSLQEVLSKQQQEHDEPVADDEIAEWAERHDIKGGPIDLRCMFEDAASLTAAQTQQRKPLMDEQQKDAARWAYIRKHWKTINFRFNKRPNTLSGFTLTISDKVNNDDAYLLEKEIDDAIEAAHGIKE